MILNTIEDTYASDHYEIMRGLIHPDDWWEYDEGIPERTQGKNLDRELYLLILLHNENVLLRIDALTDLYSNAGFAADLATEIEKKEPFAVGKNCLFLSRRLGTSWQRESM